ncbi:MAG: hypothetical protein ACM359_08595 [Bacillota bacterium]
MSCAKSVARRTGITHIDLLVVLLALAACGATAATAITAAQERANRIKCASNLQQIGQGFMMYANENKGRLPRTRCNPDEPKLNFYAGSKSPGPFAEDGPAPNDVTAALFLVIRRGLKREVFLCPTQHKERPSGRLTDLLVERALEEQIIAAQQTLNRLRAQRGGPRVSVMKLTPLPASLPADAAPEAPKPAWDVRKMSNFPGPDDLSYSIANPYPSSKAISIGYKCSFSVPADFALAADINPGGATVVSVTADSAVQEMHKANSPNHGGEGQNVLYMDGHVEWTVSPFVGAHRDNIYTRAKANAMPRGPEQESVPASVEGTDPALALDSILLPSAGQRPTTAAAEKPSEHSEGSGR